MRRASLSLSGKRSLSHAPNLCLTPPIRTVFVIDPKKVIRLTISYPAQTGRSFDEVIRVIDSLQLGDKHKITTPVNWNKGDDVIVHPAVSNEQANTLFPNYRQVLVRTLLFTLTSHRSYVLLAIPPLRQVTVLIYSTVSPWNLVRCNKW
jgi:hypothetical protein